MELNWFAVLALLGLSCAEGSLLTKVNLDTHIHQEEQLISQHNNIAYVQRVMRLAKSAEMRSYMQPDLDACENFYEFSCGNWPKINPANDGHAHETSFQQTLTKGYYHKQQKLLEQPANAERDDAAVLKLKQFYASCLHYRQKSKSDYLEELREIVAEFGHMPALRLPEQQANESSFDWLATVAQIKRKYGLDIILLLQAVPDAHNTTQKLYVGQPPQFAVEPDRAAVAARIAKQLEQHLGVEPTVAGSAAQEIAELEMLLSRGMASRPLGALAQPRTAADLRNASTYNLTRYVELVLERPLQPEEIIYEHVPSYLLHLETLLNSTSTRVLANYIFQQLLQHFYYEHSAPVVAQCLASVRKQFPELLNHLVYRQYADAATLAEMNTIWLQLKRSFGQVLENATRDWLSNETRTQLLEQLNATKLLIDGQANVNFTERYKQLELKPQNHLANMRAVLSQRSVLAPPAPISTEARFVAEDNVLLLPVAMLQPNFLWSHFYPRALHFGSLGTLLAQHLFHALDNRTGWDSAALAEFGKRKACFKHQYERLRLGGEYLPATELQDENIADNTAIQVAYQAYVNYLSSLAASTLTSENLPQLSVSPQQLFFISYAQIWCKDSNEQFMAKQSLLATHTPNALRVQGALSNSAAFSSAFGCAKHSRMNPSKKCHMYSNELS